ncbi:CapA family protein, partial [Aeromicrobium sp.]|uniref:CapA family protein n=1 Tax=Aeromicrobium sp. TaxID=1871063 RepID=UPI002FC8BA19
MSIVLRISILAGLVLAGCTDTDRRAQPPSSPPTPPTYDMPIALVTHLSRGAVDLTERQARDVLAGQLRDWSALGQETAPLRIVTAGVAEAAEQIPSATDPAAAVATVERSRGTLAVVPATAVTPRVRAVTVGRVSPVRRPGAYPLTTQSRTPPGAVLTTSIVGDIMLGRRVGESLARADDPAAALRPMARRLAAADVTVGNLESTLSKSGAPQQGGDSFGADPDVLAGLELAGFDVLSVANNHLGDYGERAIGETIAELRAGGFTPVGGGTDLAQARRAAIVERKGVRIGFIATDSIGETPAATADRPGTNRINAP